MKKLLLLAAAIGVLLSGCTKLEGSIDALGNRIDTLEHTTIPSIEEQIEAVNISIAALEEVDEELEKSIKALENNDKATAEEITALKAKDAELDAKIAELKEYVKGQLNSTKDWISATFATLEQYGKLTEDVAAVQALVENYKNEATQALNTAIANLETSLKAWVGEKLADYAKIADVNAEIAKLEKAITNGDSALQEELNKLKSQLETTKQEVTEAYQKAIKEAIETNNGVINAKIAEEIGKVNVLIEELNSKLAKLQTQVDKNTEDIAKLLARIQSVSYIPKYSDGKATLKYISGASQVVLDFKVSPKESIAELAKVWENTVKVDAVYTETRAVSFINMPIVKFDANPENGVISVIASGENLADELFAGVQSASVSLTISDDNNSITSEHIPIVAKEVELSQLLVPANQIWYTSTDGKIVEPARTDVFDARITSNKYEKGLGIIRFDAPVTQMYIYTFCNTETNIGAHNLETIILPNGVQEIGEYAFYDCSSLKSVTIPPSVTRMRGYAFGNCNNLTRVDISDLSAWCKIVFSEKAQANPLSNGAKLYLDGNEVTDLIIPSDITELKFGAFCGCSSLTSVIIPESVSTIHKSAFALCANLTDVIISNSVISPTDTHIFSNCSSLTNVTLSENITLISDYMFQNCSSLTNINIPNGVTSIGKYAFEECSSLTSINIPNGVTSIGGYAFYHCAAMANVYIPNSVVSIGMNAFRGCSLTSVTIPDSVVELGPHAFADCEKMKTFYGKFASEDNRCLIIDGLLNSFAPSGLTEYTIPDGVTKIGIYAFHLCSRLTNIAIPNSVTSIENYAFYGCSGLTSITIPNSVTSIGSYAFYGCSGLTSITIPDGVVSIGNCAFSVCKKLASVYCEPTTPPTGGISMFNSNATGRKIYVPQKSVNAYKSADSWSNYTNYILGYDF